MKKFILVIIVIILVLIFGFYTINSSKTTETGNSTQDNLTKITLKVDIPCPGHSGLIKGYLIQAGVSEVKFRFPNLFDVYYDPVKISREQIIGISIFKEYPAKIIK